MVHLFVFRGLNRRIARQGVACGGNGILSALQNLGFWYFEVDFKNKGGGGMERPERKLINVRLPVTTLAKLKRLAASECRSVSNWLYATIEKMPEPDQGGEESQK